MTTTQLRTIAEDPNPIASPTPKVLVVDDVEDNRAILVRQLTRKGFEVVEARGGREALRCIDAQGFDAVLLDIMMPDLDGVAVLGNLRKRFSAAELPVIMVTADAHTESTTIAFEAGANDYVTKPFDFSVVLARVNIQVARHRSELATRKAQSVLNEVNRSLEATVAERSARLIAANAAAVQEGRRHSEMQSKVEFLAHHDALTGLSNRFAFDQQLVEAQRTLPETGGRLCVLFVDLDGFKSINDTLGHAVGDALLQDVARRFSEALGREDFIARLGGDEFGVIHISKSDYDAVERLAERLIRSAAACNTVDGYEVVVSASVGIGIGADELSDPFALVRQADLAMYHAKSSDRGQFRLFEPDMESSAQRRRDLEINLRKAFSNDELELHYQPIVDLAKGRVVCLEALMRWTHPKHGPVSPDEFIGLAEEIGLIHSMGEWALRRACADAAQWPSQWRLAVNISPRQFRNSGLLATVVGALAASGLRADRLELEITESLFLDGNAETLETLKALRNLGVRVVLDDFGIGCAGLNYLRSFRFDGLKIDKSFVRTMSTDRASAAIVRSAIGLGASLGMKTIGEGVESEVELRRLVREGCSEAQGFLLGRPRPVGDVPATIESAERSIRDWIGSPQSLFQVVSRVLRSRKNIPRNVRLGSSVD